MSDKKIETAEIKSFNTIGTDVSKMVELSDDELGQVAGGASGQSDLTAPCKSLSSCTINGQDCPKLTSCTGNWAS
jgi:hypothetical protein